MEVRCNRHLRVVWSVCGVRIKIGRNGEEEFGGGEGEWSRRGSGLEVIERCADLEALEALEVLEGIDRRIKRRNIN